MGMQMELRFFATFREAVGQKHLEREYPTSQTAGDILHELAAEYQDLELFSEDGELREHLSIMRNGRDITFLDELDTEIGDGDTLSLFPPVAGGAGTTIERTFRGISQRAAIHYLNRLGGARVGEDTVAGSDWQATVSTDQVCVGPTLQLTEVTVRFEGCERVVDPVVADFARKARRAGG